MIEDRPILDRSRTGGSRSRPVEPEVDMVHDVSAVVPAQFVLGEQLDERSALSVDPPAPQHRSRGGPRPWVRPAPEGR